MSVEIGSIQVGKCFVTPTGQVRRIIKIENGKVTYEARGSIDSGGSWGSWTTVGDHKFSMDVDREVTCDWDKNYPERKP